jgi:hypothetical protein
LLLLFIILIEHALILLQVLFRLTVQGQPILHWTQHLIRLEVWSSSYSIIVGSLVGLFEKPGELWICLGCLAHL